MALDIKVLDADKNEIEIKELDDDELPSGEKPEEMSPGATVDDSLEGGINDEDAPLDEFDINDLDLGDDFGLDDDI